jgi:hypothetical protein
MVVLHKEKRMNCTLTALSQQEEPPLFDGDFLLAFDFS